MLDVLLWLSSLNKIFRIFIGIIGACILKGMSPEADSRNLSVTFLAPDVTLSRGFGYEIIFTFIYTWIHYASKTSRDTFKGFGGPLAIGLFYGMSHVILVSNT